MEFNWLRSSRVAWHRLAVLIGAGTLLAACSSGDSESSALAEQMPKVRAGEWRITVAVDGDGGDIPATMCQPEIAIDDLLISGLPGNGSNCGERTLEQRSPTSWVLHAVCNFIRTGDREADTAVTIDTRVSGDLRRSYRVESKQVMSQPMNGVSRQTILQIGQRLGDC